MANINKDEINIKELNIKEETQLKKCINNPKDKFCNTCKMFGYDSLELCMGEK